MKQYAKVIVRNNSIHTDNLFTYEIPDFFSENILKVTKKPDCSSYSVKTAFASSFIPDISSVYNI